MISKTLSPPRKPLTTEDLARLSVNELLDLSLSDEEMGHLKELNELRMHERLRRAGRLSVEAAPLLSELRGAGLRITSVGDLANMRERYEPAIPILLRHLKSSYSDSLRTAIARGLAVPERGVQEAWDFLVDQYREEPMGLGIVDPGGTKLYRLQAKDGLACVLAASVNGTRLPELIELSKSRSLGDSRLFLLQALKKRRRKNLLVQAAIEELVGDPELSAEILSWKK